MTVTWKKFKDTQTGDVIKYPEAKEKKMGKDEILDKMYSRHISQQMRDLPKAYTLSTSEVEDLERLRQKVKGNDHQVDVTHGEWHAFTKALDARGGG